MGTIAEDNLILFLGQLKAKKTWNTLRFRPLHFSAFHSPYHGAARKSHITFARKLHHSQFTDLIVYMKHNGKEMWFECEQLFLSGKRCVTLRKTAAKETSNQLELKQKLTRLLLAHLFARCPRVFASGFYWCAGLSLSSWLATEEILQAMKQTMKRSIRLMQARHVVDLLPDLTQTERKGYSMTVYSFLTVFKTFYSVSKEHWRRNVLKFKLSFPNSFLALVARLTDNRKKEEVQILANA